MPSRDNRFTRYLAEYAADHRTPGNKLTHQIGVPLLAVTIAGLLAKVQLGDAFAGGLMALDLGLFVWCLTTVWYLSMDWRIGLPASAANLACYMLGRQFPLVWLMAAFIIGWIIQLIGHVHYEHNRPAFLKNLRQLLIGPVWIFGKWFHFLPPLDGRTKSPSFDRVAHE